MTSYEHFLKDIALTISVGLLVALVSVFVFCTIAEIIEIIIDDITRKSRLRKNDNDL